MPVNPAADALRLLYQDRELIVVDKPAGLPSQPDLSGPDDLLSLLSRQLAIPVSGLFPVHRLDRPVSGLLVVARTATAQTNLTRQLASHEMGKTYQAVVCGAPEPPCGELADYLAKSERLNTSRVTSANSRSAKLARLTYQTLARMATTEGQILSLLQIDLQTGRHHQIRVQLAHAGCPLWGDTKYNPALQRAGGWHQLALCATGIRFRHPQSGELMTFSRSLPDQAPFNCFADYPAVLCDKMKEQG